MCHRLPPEIPAGLTLPQALDPLAPPTAADLAETEDIQLTPAIRAKAAELNNHPVQIHNWVRNTIEYRKRPPAPPTCPTWSVL